MRVSTIIFLLVCIHQCLGATNPPTPATTTDPGTTTAAATTTTPAVTTTTEGTTTTTEPITTTPIPEETTTTAQQSPSFALLSFGDVPGDSSVQNSDDGCWLVQDAGYDIPFARNNFRRVYACVNGVVCFGRPYNGYYIPSNYETLTKSKGLYCLAPFMMDHTTESSGKLWWHVYDVGRVCSLSTDGTVIAVRDLVRTSYDATYSPLMTIQVTWDGVGQFDGLETDSSTFQLAFTTDGERSYSFYFYAQDKMRSAFGTAFIGQILDSFATGLSDNSIDGTYLRRPDRNLRWKGKLGAYAVPDDNSGSPNYRAQCMKWYACEENKIPEYQAALSAMPVCPCTLSQGTFNPDFDFSASTFLKRGSSFEVNLLGSSGSNGYGKTCTYNSRMGFFTLRGSFTKYHPINSRQMYLNEDVYYRTICCDQSDLCGLYNAARPEVTRCFTRREVFRFANTFGDPHFTTIDGLEYTFNGHGEYVLMKIASKNVEIQARTQPYVKETGNATLATVFTAFVVKGPNLWLQVELTMDRTSMQIYAGLNQSVAYHVDYTTAYYADNNFRHSDTAFSLARYSKTLVTKFPSLGIMFNVTQGRGLLQMGFALSGDLKNKLSGLLGNFNDNPNDDLLPRDATTPIVPNSSDEAIFLNFGRTWAIQESYFRYRAGRTSASYNFPNFRPGYYESISDADRAAALSVCGANAKRQCIYDYAYTGDRLLAAETVSSINDLVVLNDISNNQIPSINVSSGAVFVNGVYYVHANVGTQTTLTLSATDDGAVTITNVTNTAGATVVSNGNSATVTFTLANTNPVALSFIATDQQGATSAELEVIIVICTGCSGHGSCDFTTFREKTNMTVKSVIAKCNCTGGSKPYWEGDDCSMDFNGCAEGPCLIGQTCTDTPAQNQAANSSLPFFTCSPCPTGFSPNGTKCSDNNECLPNNPCVLGTCKNTVGSFLCLCNKGYRLYTDKSTCKDINECAEGTHNCDQICTNIPGNYSCTCHSGYQRNAAGNACVVGTTDSVCTNNPCPNADGCYGANNTAKCFCKEGYKLNETNNACTNIDECKLGICSQGCKDTNGSFTCSCYTGYELDADKITCNPCPFPKYGVGCASQCNCASTSTGCDPVRGCVCSAGWTGTKCENDIDECSNPNICNDPNKKCVNNDGSYYCICRDGYQLNTINSCVDIDECAQADATGSLCQQTCTNTAGGYTCTCLDGFKLDTTDNSTCNDIDECALGIANCEQICVNVDGRFNCDCNQGYEINTDRRTCTLIPAEDPCASVTKTCSHICNLVNGTVECSCPTGYRLGQDKQNCIDIDECSDNTLNLCSEKSSCVNSEGGFACSCSTGSKLANDLRTCVACDKFHWGDNCANACECGPGAASCNAVSGCVCLNGWTGDKCNTDRDECGSSPCTANNEQCINTPGSYECKCMTGYELNGNGNCVDIDECTTTKPCSQNCANTVGSYTCSCNTGYTKSGDTCIDIDECAGQHDCQQVCTNTAGSYICSCQTDYEINADRKTCTAINPCTTNTCSGSFSCLKINGTDTCTCNQGYTFDTNSNTVCIDIKECAQNSTNKCNQGCLEKAGGYSCYCNQPGYKLDADQATCIVCEAGKYGTNCTSTCSCLTNNNQTKSCNHVTGSCTCWGGWNGTNCGTNINECKATSNPCPVNSACVDNLGSYSCVCSVGFTKAADGTCAECDSSHYGNGCEKTCSCVAANTANCNRINGTCTCKPGWTGNNCSTNINECETPTFCKDDLKTCTDTPGSYICSCINGYTLNVNGSCLDKDECLLGTHTCNETAGQLCINTNGTFRCGCKPGYSKAADTCTPCLPNTWGTDCRNTCNCNANNSVGPSPCDPAKGCICKDGWTGSNCSVNIDECTTNTAMCPANSVCTDSPGSYTCSCKTGYKSTNGSCVICTGSTYGENCTSACNCVNDHAMDPTQSCNYVTGRCECKATWSGTRCETDVDECAADTTLCKNIANQGCHNTDGSFECSCFVGFEKVGGACIDSNATTTTFVAPAGEVSVDMTVTLNYNISVSDDLNVNSTYVEYKDLAKQGFEAYFLQTMSSTNFKRILVRDIQRGSLKANLTVVIADTNYAQQNFSQAVYNLLKEGTVKIGNTPSSTEELRIGGATVTPATVQQNALICTAYLTAHGPCTAKEDCVVNTAVPSCQPVPTSDNFALVIGLGVGIPLFFVAVLVIAIVAVYVHKLRKRSSTQGFDRTSFERGFFPTAIPTKINTYGRNDPLYVPYTWDQESSASFTSSSTEASKKRRRKIRGDAYPEPDINYVYDNSRENHFSWDFLYNYIAPNERYEIQRPRLNGRREY